MVTTSRGAVIRVNHLSSPPLSGWQKLFNRIIDALPLSLESLRFEEPTGYMTYTRDGVPLTQDEIVAHEKSMAEREARRQLYISQEQNGPQQNTATRASLFGKFPDFEDIGIANGTLRRGTMTWGADGKIVKEDFGPVTERHDGKPLHPDAHKYAVKAFSYACQTHGVKECKECDPTPGRLLRIVRKHDL